MKRYVFRLETVRRVRRAEESRAKSELLVANNEATKAIQATEKLVAEYNAATSLDSGVTSVDSFMRQRYFNQLSGEAVIAALASQAAAELEAAVKRDLYTDAARRVKALDRLDNRRHSEYEIEARRQEDLEVDDIVTGRHTRKPI